ncbi:MAG: hypothetical protein OEZ35_08715 [Candidatus Bathyarchaeota archaeon]|nr:hypothetical protein [Candidatus Bathyarchaeota archaeon]
MVEVGRGLKAGVVSGVIYGVVNAIVNIIVMGVIFPSVFPEFFVQVFGFVEMIILVVLFVAGLIAGATIGLIFGFIFAVLYKELPGRTSVIKGAIFSIVLWVILGLTMQLAATSVGWPPSEARFLVSIPIMISLGTSILLGILLGYFWDRLSP